MHASSWHCALWTPVLRTYLLHVHYLGHYLHFPYGIFICMLLYITWMQLMHHDHLCSHIMITLARKQELQTLSLPFTWIISVPFIMDYIWAFHHTHLDIHRGIWFLTTRTLWILLPFKNGPWMNYQLASKIIYLKYLLHMFMIFNYHVYIHVFTFLTSYLPMHALAGSLFL